MDSIQHICDAFKQQGNTHLKANQLQKAIDSYTKAIDNSKNGNIPHQKISVYYSNRSQCHIKMENYGLSLNDGLDSLRFNPNYAKAYYRTGSAYIVLGKTKQAYDAFLKAFELGGKKDQMIYNKLKEIKAQLDQKKKEQRLRIFQGLKGYGHHSVSINWRQIIVTDYAGPKLQQNDSVTTQWVIKLMDYFRDQKKLHKRYALQLIEIVKNHLMGYKALVDYKIDNDEQITICGDIHGQYYDLMNIFKLNGYPSIKNKYLFNGDFVDRGSFSVESMLTLIAWKAAHPQILHLTRGNHQAKTVNMIYGFKGQVQNKYSTEVYDAFSQLFCYLPLCYVINQKVMVCHGGLFAEDGVKLEDIRNYDRVKQPPEKGIMCDLLWADPCANNGREVSKRGVSMAFGPDITSRFLSDNGLSNIIIYKDMLIRSHEVKHQGYQQAHEGKCITIFSAPNYCDQMGNKGAFIRLNGKQLKPKYTKFDAVPHPNIKPMAYAAGFGGLF